MANTPEEIVYGESVRAITAQERTLDELRARAGTLLAAAAIATSFLGGQTLQSHHHLTGWSWAAILGFVGCAAGALIILLPWGNWWFVTSATTLIEDHLEKTPPATPAELYRFLACALEGHFDRNLHKLDVLQWLFRFATFLLAVEVVAWLADLAGR
jgi:hypothetical protein